MIFPMPIKNCPKQWGHFPGKSLISPSMNQWDDKEIVRLHSYAIAHSQVSYIIQGMVCIFQSNPTTVPIKNHHLFQRNVGLRYDGVDSKGLATG